MSAIDDEKRNAIDDEKQNFVHVLYEHIKQILRIKY